MKKLEQEVLFMEKAVISRIFQQMNSRPFSVRYWDGSAEFFGKGKPEFTIQLQDKISKQKILYDISLALGEAYMDGIININGRIQDVLDAAFRCDLPFFSKKAFSALSLFSSERWGTSVAQQKKDIQHHYDLGNDFYALWLDKTMSYSCAYFCNPEDSLYQAQLQKIDYTLKKLQLHQDERLLDIGSGWGWLMIRAAQQYGVKAMGITLSQEQYDRTRERIQELGLKGQVEVELMDYRDLANSGQKFDKVVSVGMIEHVGNANLPKYFAAVKRLLQPGGISLLHCITGLTEGPCNRWIRKYIFPGGYIPSLRQLIALMPDYDFHLLDAESLRLHYARTLDHWAENFEAHLLEIQKKYGERFVRMWRLYLNSCASSFRNSGLDIHQMVFTSGLNNKLEMTRHFLYR